MDEPDFSPELEALVFHESLSGWKVTAPVFRLHPWLHWLPLSALVGLVPLTLALCAAAASGDTAAVVAAMISMALTAAAILILLSEHLKTTLHVEGDDMAVRRQWMGYTWRTHRVPLHTIDTEQLGRHVGGRLHLTDDLTLRVSLPPAERALLRRTITESAQSAGSASLPPEPAELRRLRTTERDPS